MSITTLNSIHQEFARAVDQIQLTASEKAFKVFAFHCLTVLYLTFLGGQKEL